MEELKLAIIGGGPRGLSALESIYGAINLDKNVKKLHTLLFETEEIIGAGHVYNNKQPDTNWLNVSERGLTIPQREEILGDALRIPSFPSYQNWAGYQSNKDNCEEPDVFPLRSKVGEYLNERYESIATILQKNNLLTVIYGKVVETDWKEGKFEIVTEGGQKYYANELVMTIGHQPTRFDDQMSNWINHYKSNNLITLLTKPYPIKYILSAKHIDSKSKVAIRGFGLAMIDVMRCLTIGFGGKFEVIDAYTQKMAYIKSGNEPMKIIPFSLDGLPMAPKLVNLEIDKLFFPTKKEKREFQIEIGTIAKTGTAKSNDFLIDAIVPIICRVFISLEDRAYACRLEKAEISRIIKTWLLDDGFEHSLIVPKDNSPIKTLEAFIGMAVGTSPVSLDFCIGHVWRHCQPTLYKALSFSNLDDEVVADIISLDERLKRYSYGPPVASLQQLMALIKEGIVTLDFVNNPDINTKETGWELSNGKAFELVSTMINSVLDPPKLLNIDSQIVCNLLHDSLVQPLHGELGIQTYRNGCVVLPKNRDAIPLAVLGRLSKGTLIGVDAILECFGVRSELWARGVVERNYV